MPTINELSTLFDKSKINLHSNHLTRLINIDGDCAWSFEVDTQIKELAIYSFKNGNKSELVVMKCATKIVEFFLCGN